MCSIIWVCFRYGIRYKYGIFEQLIQDNKQIERPDYWLSKGNPWEIERLDVVYPVRFYGHVVTHHQDGKTLFKWEGGEVVQAVAYDTPIPGFGTVNTNTMRLWSAYAPFSFNFECLRSFRFIHSCVVKCRSGMSWVSYTAYQYIGSLSVLVH